MIDSEKTKCHMCACSFRMMMTMIMIELLMS